MQKGPEIAPGTRNISVKIDKEIIKKILQRNKSLFCGFLKSVTMQHFAMCIFLSRTKRCRLSYVPSEGTIMFNCHLFATQSLFSLFLYVCVVGGFLAWISQYGNWRSWWQMVQFHINIFNLFQSKIHEFIKIF